MIDDKALLEKTRLDHICLKPKLGAAIGPCILEAIAMACVQQTKVIMEHSGTLYKIRPDDILQYVIGGGKDE